MGHEQIKTSSEKSGLWFTEDFSLTEHAALTLDHIQGWAPNAGATRHPRTWSSSTCVMGLAAHWVLSIACWTAITLVSFQLVLKWLCLEPEDPACLPPTVIWLGLLLSKHLGQLSLSLSGSAFCLCFLELCTLFSHCSAILTSGWMVLKDLRAHASA